MQPPASSEENSKCLAEWPGANAAEQLWPVFEAYRLVTSPRDRAGTKVHEVLQGAGEPVFYAPMNRPELPFQLAKVGMNDQNAALAFVHAWGNLNALVHDKGEYYVHGTPLWHLFGHAKTIRDVLNLYAASRSEDQMSAFKKALGQAFERDLTLPFQPRELFAWWWQRGIETRRYFLVQHQENMKRFDEMATALVQIALRSNLEGIRADVDSPAYSPPQFGTMENLHLTFRWTHLAEVAYWHLAKVITERREIRRCKQCQGFFEPNDIRQQFCPAPRSAREEARAGQRSRAQSLCGLRYRSEKLRTLRKNESLQAGK